MTTPHVGARPAVDHIGLTEDGAPFLQGSRCSACLETFVGSRQICARCGARTGLTSLHLAETGRIHTCSVVHRSFPGVPTPFISAVVALDGGGSVQATVREAPTAAAEPLLGAPVRLVFADSGQHDAQGAPFLAYHFVPAGAG